MTAEKEEHRRVAESRTKRLERLWQNRTRAAIESNAALRTHYDKMDASMAATDAYLAELNMVLT